MVSDSEPRYRLVDSQGNTVGTLYAKSGGTLALQEGSSGSDNEIELQTDGTLQTDSINTDSLDIADVFNTASDDSELSDAIANASDGDAIFLSNSKFTADHHFDKKLKLIGTDAPQSFLGTTFSGQVTFGERLHFKNINFDRRADTTISQRRISFEFCTLGLDQYTIDADEVTFVGCADLDVVFNSGTSGGFVTACRSSTVTDNGSNTVPPDN